jgi:hypothetical protein
MEGRRRYAFSNARHLDRGIAGVNPIKQEVNLMKAKMKLKQKCVQKTKAVDPKPAQEGIVLHAGATRN